MTRICMARILPALPDRSFRRARPADRPVECPYEQPLRRQTLLAGRRTPGHSGTLRRSSHGDDLRSRLQRRLSAATLRGEPPITTPGSPRRRRTAQDRRVIHWSSSTRCRPPSCGPAPGSRPRGTGAGSPRLLLTSTTCGVRWTRSRWSSLRFSRTTRPSHGADPLAGLTVADADVRRACETQARSHALHLRESYIECAAQPKALAGVVSASAASFRAPLRHGRLHGERGPLDDGAHDACGRAHAAAGRRGIVRQVFAAATRGSLAAADAEALFPRISQPPTAWCDMSMPGAPDPARRRARARGSAGARGRRPRGARCAASPAAAAAQAMPVLSEPVTDAAGVIDASSAAAHGPPDPRAPRRIG